MCDSCHALYPKRVIIHTYTALNTIPVRSLQTTNMGMRLPSEACYRSIMAAKCVMHVVPHAQCMESIRVCTTPNYLPVRRRFMIDRVIGVTSQRLWRHWIDCIVGNPFLHTSCQRLETLNWNLTYLRSLMIDLWWLNVKCVSCRISEACYLSIVAGKCVMDVVHLVRGMKSIHTYTALNYMPVRHLHTIDAVIGVNSHRFVFELIAFSVTQFPLLATLRHNSCIHTARDQRHHIKTWHIWRRDYRLVIVKYEPRAPLHILGMLCIHCGG